MLHTKSRGNRSTGPGEEYFEGFLTIYGRGSHVTQIQGKTLLFSLLNCFDWQSGFGGEDV